MCASALPGENGTHEISIKMNTKRQNNIRNVIGCNLKKDDQILIVFGASIPDTTVHQTTVQVPTSPTVCLCITWKNQNKRHMR